MSDDTITHASVTYFGGKTLSQFSSLSNMKSTTDSNLPLFPMEMIVSTYWDESNTATDRITKDNTNNRIDIKNTNTGMFVGITVGVLVSLIFCAFNIFMAQRKKKSKNSKTKHINKGIEKRLYIRCL